MNIKLALTSIFFLIASFCPAQKLDLSNLHNLNIRNVGPANMSGRITAIDVDNSNPKLIYVGAASGGVWKSENGGTSWKPVFDDQPTQNIGAIALQQNNPDIVWVGTGEGNPRNSVSLGMGVFKSLDGGKTWSHMGLDNTKAIHRIIIDPENSDVVYAGAMGDPFTPNTDRGLYKTTDGGLSWSKILYTNDQSGLADLVMDPSNPNKILAAMYEHKRTPYYFSSGGPGSGLFMTIDAGKTWRPLGSKNGLPKGELGRIGLAIAPSDRNRIYAKVEAARNAIYRSDDGGENWIMVNDNPRFANNRPFYFQDLAVDSKNPERLYNIYQPLSVSYDGGKTFDPTPIIPADETKGIHADFHAFWMNPKDPENFIIGGDGGLGITNDRGKSWYFPETIPVAQLYHVNVDNDMPYNVYAGMQDNGNWSGPGYVWKRGGIRTLYWQYLVGGDGFYVSPDDDNSRFGYGTSQNGNLYRYDRLTGYYISIQPHGPDNKTVLRFNWNAAFQRDPFNKNGIYAGSQFVHKSTDKGATWEVISPDLSTNNPEHQKEDYGGLTLDFSGAESYNSILTIAASPINKEVIWVGTDDGQVQLTLDGGKTWRNLTKQVKELPKEAWIAQIKASRYAAGTAWMVVNNYRKGDYSPYLFKTEDYGKSWKRLVDRSKVSGYALSLMQDVKEPNLVFMGTENGLWISIDEGHTWEQIKNGFPSVSTMDLTIQERESALIIGTFGRAIWILDDLLSLREIASGRLKQKFTALPVNDAVQVKGIFIAPPGNIWTGFNTTFEGENKVFQKTKIPYFIKSIEDTTDVVTAQVYNNKGDLINTIRTRPDAKGLNYIIWKLDEQLNNSFDEGKHNDSKGIPVLPGDYKIKLSYKDAEDETSVKVIADPRFNINPAVDQELYAYQKGVKKVEEQLSKALSGIDGKTKTIEKLIKDLKEEKVVKGDSLIRELNSMKEKLADLRAKGEVSKPNRQIGAWQSGKITPSSKLYEASKVAMSGTTIPSEQELKLFETAKQMVELFVSQVDQFLSNDWKSFAERINSMYSASLKLE